MNISHTTITPECLGYYNEHIKELKIVGAPVEEQDTVINFSRDKEYAYVETTDNLMLHKLASRVRNGEWKVVHVTVPGTEHAPNEITSITFKGSKKLIQIRAKKQTGRELTEEQREAARARLMAAREKNKQ